ncbi:MAG: CADD family putative folate metabolism protein [Actinobacteria bacterium]|nr:MAG: CADD family putative folate metabolism protein [Actinomycetota bacterium]
MGWTREIDALVERKHLLKHPFYTAWTEGTLSLEALRGYAGQYYRHVLSFPTYLSAVHPETPDLETRQYLLENLIDEERGSENHPELWLRFAEGIGCRREDIRAAAPLPETAASDRTFREIAATGPAGGLASLYAYESMVPAVAASKIDGLRRHYGIASVTPTSRVISSSGRFPPTSAPRRSGPRRRRWTRCGACSTA